MKKTIKHVTLVVKDMQVVTLPAGAAFLGVAKTKANNIILAARVKETENENLMRKREIRMYKEGDELDEYDLVFIGTVEGDDNLVHVYENTNP